MGWLTLAARRGLAPETLAGAVVGRALADHLERHAPVQAVVLRSVDHAHAALSELAHNPILAESRRRLEIGRCIGLRGAHGRLERAERIRLHRLTGDGQAG